MLLENAERTTTDIEEISLLGMAGLVFQRWRIIAALTVSGAVVGIGVAMLRPNSYVARTVLVPAPSNSGGGSSLAVPQLGGAMPALLGRGENAHQKLVSAILESRSLEDSIIQRALPRFHDGPDPVHLLREIVHEETAIQSNTDGSVVVEVRDADPELATALANLYPDIVNRIATQITADVAERKRQFLEQQVEMAHRRLKASEQALVRFQERHGTPDLPAQASRTIDAAAELREAILMQELKVAELRRTATQDNPELRAAQAGLAAQREQLRRLTSGANGRDLVFLSLEQSPELTVLATRLAREYARYEQEYLAMIAAAADAQVDAQDNLPIVSVLDRAIVPTLPAGMSGKRVIALSAFLGLLFGVLAVFAGEYLRSARQEPASEPFFTALDRLRIVALSPVRHRRNRV
jgi:uncharacterized protein involved in exopolysaccharide biosynthesis